MPDDEGEALFAAALRAGGPSTPAAPPPTFVEIGAWCGKSTVYLGAAAEATGAALLSVDHHRGSEENQPGWEYHEPDLVDPEIGRIDTLPHWRRTITSAGLEASVVGIVGDSPTLAARWDRPLAFCFIDGGHGEDPAWADFHGWAPHVALGGLAGDPRRVPRSGRRRAPALRAVPARRCARASSPTTARAAACALLSPLTAPSRRTPRR